MARFDPPQTFDVETVVFFLTTGSQVLWTWRSGVGHQVLITALLPDGQIVVRGFTPGQLLRYAAPIAPERLAAQTATPLAHILSAPVDVGITVHGMYDRIDDAVADLRSDSAIARHMNRR